MNADEVAEVRDAANRGDMYAQFRLGSLYHAGEGLPRDLDAAVRWYSRAAASGNLRAHMRLAAMLDKGQGLARDKRRAKGMRLDVIGKLVERVAGQLKANPKLGLNALSEVTEVYRLDGEMGASIRHKKATAQLDSLERLARAGAVDVLKERARQLREEPGGHGTTPGAG